MIFNATPSSLKGQVILITGAAGGIGASTAMRLAKHGAQLALCDLDQSALNALSARLNNKPLLIHTDVTHLDSCLAAVETARQHFGRIDAVWANAGISAFAPLELMAADAWHRVINVNLLGTYNIIKAALPEIIHARGYVAITASGASWAHSPGHSAYATSKAGVEALANSLRVELADRGVRVGVFHPMWIRTPMVTEKQDQNAAFNAFFNALPAPLRKITEADEFAAVLERAFARRASKVIYPDYNWMLHGIRAFLPTKALTATTRRIAPEIRRIYARQIQDASGQASGLPERYQNSSPPASTQKKPR